MKQTKKILMATARLVLILAPAIAFGAWQWSAASPWIVLLATLGVQSLALVALTMWWICRQAWMAMRAESADETTTADETE